MKKKIIFYLAILLFLIPALLPLFQPGFFETDDGEWMVIRFAAFYSAFKDGQIPVRFLHSLNNGLGYPVPTFLYPGFMYFGLPIQIITSNFILTIKTILFISIAGSVFFTFLWLRKYFSLAASFTGAIISAYLPYRLYDLYGRGSVGELFALMWVPFILWMIEKNSFFWTTVGIFLLIISHNTMVVLFMPVILLYMLIKFYNDKKKSGKYPISYIISILIGIGMSSFFILPVLIELGYTQFASVQVSDPKEYFAGLDLIGFVAFVVLSASAVLFIWKNKAVLNIKYLYGLFFLTSIFAIIFSSPVSGFIWEKIPSAWIQFPFRLLSLLLISIPFLSAFLIDRLKFAGRFLVLFIIFAVMVFSSIQFLAPKQYVSREEGFYFTNQATTTVRDEYMPKWVKTRPSSMMAEKVEIISGQGKIENILYNNSGLSFNTISDQGLKVRVNTIFWPGWEASAKGNKIDINFDNEFGVMDINAPGGTNEINFEFNETPLRIFANLVSVLSVIFLVYITKSGLIKRINLL